MSADNGQTGWDLSPLSCGTEKGFSAELATALKAAGEFAGRFRGTIAGLSAEQLLIALKEYEKLQEQLLKPQYYAHLLFAADSTAESAKRLSQQAAEAGNVMSRELLFFDLEIMALADEKFTAIINDERLANYHHYLTSTRKFSSYSLPEREEQLLKQKDLTGSTAFTRLFDELSASFTYQMEVDGELRDFTGEELLGHLHHPDPVLRERAFTIFLEKHADNRLVFSTIFNTIVLDHGEETTLRGYSQPMEPTNIGNELSNETVERLLTVTEQNYPLAQEYFRLKAKLLNLPRLKNTDVYAPLSTTAKHYSFAEAKELVLKAYGNFYPDYARLLAGLFATGRIDTYPRNGKSGGAFCMGVTPAIAPYLLLNYTGNLRDIATLAHELGHALHFILSGKQSLINYHAPLPLAETASVFGEMLLTREMLANESDKSVRISLLCAKIEDIIATTFRQTVLTRFEQRLHLQRKSGLLADADICELWREENGRLFGDAVEMIDAYRWGWIYISHFIHTRFYCYSYTFAELLVLALYREYQLQGAAFLPGYQAILESGGSLSPAATAALAGVDINGPHFWQQGYDILAGLLDELKSLL
jgi:oligoendopeptidase F